MIYQDLVHCHHGVVAENNMLYNSICSVQIDHHSLALIQMYCNLAIQITMTPDYFL